jgi:hypothetical protein
MKLAVFAALAAGALLVAGCVEQTTYETTDESDRVGKLLLDKLPAEIQHRLHADLDGKIILHGYDLDAAEARAGGSLTVTWYWECKEAPGPGWRLFTHVLDDQERSRVNRDKVGPIRKHFQPEHWRKGLVVRDLQRIRIPKTWPGEALELRIGLWKGEQRMKVVKGPVDKGGRVKGPRVSTKPAEPIEVEIPYATAAPQIDGAIDEQPWKEAVALGRFEHTITGDEARRGTDVRLLWDTEHLYVAMKAVDDHLQSRYEKHDDELWNEDAFEIFLDPGGDKKHYYEIQVSPAGVVFDSHLRSYRKNRNEWTSAAKAAVEAAGTLNDPADDDGGWSAELAIPFGTLTEGGGVPPKAGDGWRANFFRVDVTKGKPVYSAWSPPLRGDFHALDRFGSVVFGAPPAPPGDAGAPEPSAAADASTGPVPTKQAPN